ncbi:PLP-dependent aminotransferase family protein [Alkalihalobacillus oceani]|uniref:PLP-dependent aminotransferase family protein n=1 Tax=Halalkalibacter oceani TaxID=1653776 RepID=A0A9X2DVY3_9BACI|nr:PLP-dependent aminotransferase family protein [Halalkalibacter oceani]MCM3716532.1 PLP-dependent aminotransferase family protein [Halalkalibacter oceani]
MEWKPDKSNEFPLYKQISNFFEARILNGELPPGSKLPSERNLAKSFQVNRSTVNSALEELKAMGLIETLVGAGTVVSDHLTREQGRLPNWSQYINEGFYQPNNPVNQMINQLIQTDKDMINFGIGELNKDLLPVDVLTHIHRQITFDNDLGYQHIQGNIKLRETISSHLKDYRNIEASASSIIVTSGAQQAIHLIIQCLLSPGDSVAIEDPSYAYSLPIFHSEGLKTYFLPVYEDGVDPEEVLSLYQKHRIKMIFLNPIHQNPTGHTLSIEKRQRMMEICSKYGIAIVEDDPYSLTGYQDNNLPPLKSLDSHGLVLYISSLSKVLSSGLRVGWIAGPQPVIQRIADLKQQIDFGHPNFSQLYATELLRSSQLDDHLISLRNRLKVRRDVTAKALTELLPDEISFSLPDGGIHLWCKLTNQKIDSHLLFKHAIKQGVVFAPGKTLGSEKHYMRFTFSRPDSDLIKKGIERLEQALRKYLKSRS